MLDLIIKGGRVVTPQGADVMDVGVQGDKIVAVGWPGTLAAEAARAIDATGTIVVPGGIEPHAHIGIPVPEHWAGTADVFTQPPEAATRAAAFGGVTTVIDFAGALTLDPAKAGQRESMLDVLETRRSMFQGHSHTDFAFHYILDGFECTGYPVMTILRGQVIVDHGALVGRSDAGQWLRRRVAGDVLGRPAV